MMHGFSRTGLLLVTCNTIHFRLSGSLITFPELRIHSQVQMRQYIINPALSPSCATSCWNKDPQTTHLVILDESRMIWGQTGSMSTRAFCPTNRQTQYWPYNTHETISEAWFQSISMLSDSNNVSFILLLVRGLGSVLQLLSGRGTCSKYSWDVLTYR